MNEASSVEAVIERALVQHEGERVFREVAAFARLAVDAPRLVKVMTDPDGSMSAKRTLLIDVTQDQFHGLTIELLAEASVGEARAGADINFLVQLVARVGFAMADAADRLDLVESNLDEVTRILGASGELSQTLGDSAIDSEAKKTLLHDLFANKVDPVVLSLLEVLATLDGRRIAELTRALSESAAERRGMVVAEIRSAVDLDEDRRSRLASSLEDVVGRGVRCRFLVDPGVLGSVVVRVGDEVFDGSLRHRLEQARTAVLA